jgi:sugar phosphate isomerase/epimerase
MDLGIFAKTFRRPNAHATLQAVQAIGLGYVQFNLECAGLASMPQEVPPDILSAIERARRDTGVHLVALSGTFNMAHPDADVRKSGIARFRIVAEAAKQLSIPIVTLCTGTRDPENMWRAHPENSSDQAWSDLLETMEEALAIAAASGLTLAIEPEHANVISDAGRARFLLDQLQAGDRLKIILDPANLWDASRPRHDVLKHAFDLLGIDLAVAHIKDRTNDGTTCAIGRGVVDFDLYFALLASIAFTGPVIMHGFEEAEAAESTRFARSKLTKT